MLIHAMIDEQTNLVCTSTNGQVSPFDQNLSVVHRFREIIMNPVSRQLIEDKYE
jgi:hypothetical protein